MTESLIAKYGLEEIVYEGQREGRSKRQILNDVNDTLEGLGHKKVSLATLYRFIDQSAHISSRSALQPAIAARNELMSLDLGKQIADLNNKLVNWLDEAEQARRWATDDNGNQIDLGVDWPARVSVARELRQHTRFIADVMEKIHNAAQVATFQRVLLDAVRQADPDTARRIVNELERVRGIHDAAMLGLEAAA